MAFGLAGSAATATGAFTEMLALGAVVSLLLGAVALLSSYLPARRAAGVDPATALRGD